MSSHNTPANLLSDASEDEANTEARPVEPKDGTGEIVPPLPSGSGAAGVGVIVPPPPNGHTVRTSIIPPPIPPRPMRLNEVQDVLRAQEKLRQKFAAKPTEVKAARVLNFDGLPGAISAVDAIAEWEHEATRVLAKAWTVEAMVQVAAAKKRDELLNSKAEFRELFELKRDNPDL